MTTEAARPETSSRIASFEEGLATLGAIVASLESGSLGLTESIAAYERGVGILGQLQAELARADERVSILVRLDDEGRPVLAPLAADSTPNDAGEQAAGRRRGRGKPARGRSLPGMDDDANDA